MGKYGYLVGKVLDILGNGFELSLSKDKGRRFELHKKCDKLWYSIDRKQLYCVLRRLRCDGLVEVIKKQNKGEIYLTSKGKTRWMNYQLNNLVLKQQKKWDKKWRIILFDIPEKKRKIRDSLRKKIKGLGFLEFQKSVFIYPFPCRDEINFLINFWGIEENVFYLETLINPDFIFRRHFGLK